jgi:pimeloyl-ACP methyl ester carboxylesterase
LEEAVLHCQAGTVRLAYTDQGPRGSSLVLLVHGLGEQLTGWPPSFVGALLGEGFRVVRCDNRDIGLSSRLQGRPSNTWLYFLSQFGWTGTAPYLLDDMADDVCALIEHLGAGPVHLVGASMGGMVCQIVAARHPFMVRSLTSIMSSSGDHRLPKPRPDVLRHITRPPAHPTPQEALAYRVRTRQLIQSPRFPTPLAVLEARAHCDLLRGHPDAGGTERQFAAILASGSRVELLRQMQVPTLVIHGDSDPLVPLAAGRHVHEHTPGARLEIVAGMGHDLPDALARALCGFVQWHVRSAERARPVAGARA